jgi:hypothetical protein
LGSEAEEPASFFDAGKVSDDDGAVKAVAFENGQEERRQVFPREVLVGIDAHFRR